jgi:aryl-alcohol dehydrogenase-like predicted oxidoreductase
LVVKNVQRVRFGGSGLEVSATGLGCMSMSGAYGRSDDDAAIDTIRYALDAGVNLLDTSASYGDGHNHRLIGTAIRSRRAEVVIHSKTGSPRHRDSGVASGGSPDYLRRTCEQSLRSLGIDELDVFCMSRVDPEVPIEDSVGAMAELVAAGKTRHIGLSEAAAATLARATARAGVTSLQIEYSLFSREAESDGTFPTCRRLDVAVMAYAPLSRGLLTGVYQRAEDLPPDDRRHTFPRFQAGNIESNAATLARLTDLAAAHGISLATLALAWIRARARRDGVTIVPIPSAKSIPHLEESIRAASVELSDADLADIDALVPTGAPAGTRYPAGQLDRLRR